MSNDIKRYILIATCVCMSIILGVLFILRSTYNGYGGKKIVLKNGLGGNKYLRFDSYIQFADNCFESGSINVSKYRCNAVINTPEGEVVGYYDKEGHANLVLIDKKEKAYYMSIDDDLVLYEIK